MCYIYVQHAQQSKYHDNTENVLHCGCRVSGRSGVLLKVHTQSVYCVLTCGKAILVSLTF